MQLPIIFEVHIENYLLGLAFYALERNEYAIKDFTIAIKMNLQDAYIYNYRGIYYLIIY